MNEPPSPTVGADDAVIVIGADEQSDVEVDVDRWSRLTADVLRDEHRRGELTLTFIDRDEIAALNLEHMGKAGPTDVLAFPLDAAGPDWSPTDEPESSPIPVLLGDVVICPDVAREQAPTHAGTLDDELALLVVHGVLHVLGHDHAHPPDATAMRERERTLLEAHHWGGPAPTIFRQEQQ